MGSFPLSDRFHKIWVGMWLLYALGCIVPSLRNNLLISSAAAQLSNDVSELLWKLCAIMYLHAAVSFLLSRAESERRQQFRVTTITALGHLLLLMSNPHIAQQFGSNSLLLLSPLLFLGISIWGGFF